ncbi:MAG: Ig-like domain-containing protein, partial [Bifidobacteriaceae bacterium]|nr:Ig-like domain-containing protein [Bifidobacteriaceae bacterium]
VAVTYRAECLAAAAEAIQAATGQAPLQGADAAAFYAGATSALTYANSWTPPPAPVVLLTPGLAVTPLHGAIFVAPGGTDGAGFSTSSVSRSGVTDAGKRAAPKVGAKTRVTAKVAKAKIGRGTRATVKVTVKVPGSAKPTGKVAVSWGSRTKAVTLKASAKGKVTVKLPRLSRGTYRLTVRYVDSAGKATSSSKAVRLTVA